MEKGADVCMFNIVTFNLLKWKVNGVDINNSMMQSRKCGTCMCAHVLVCLSVFSANRFSVTWLCLHMVHSWCPRHGMHIPMDKKPGGRYRVDIGLLSPALTKHWGLSHFFFSFSCPSVCRTSLVHRAATSISIKYPFHPVTSHPKTSAGSPVLSELSPTHLSGMQAPLKSLLTPPCQPDPHQLPLPCLDQFNQHFPSS